MQILWARVRNWLFGFYSFHYVSDLYGFTVTNPCFLGCHYLRLLVSCIIWNPTPNNPNLIDSLKISIFCFSKKKECNWRNSETSHQAISSSFLVLGFWWFPLKISCNYHDLDKKLRYQTFLFYFNFYESLQSSIVLSPSFMLPFNRNARRVVYEMKKEEPKNITETVAALILNIGRWFLNKITNITIKTAKNLE